MSKRAAAVLAVLAVAGGLLAGGALASARPAAADDKPLAHMVFFTLKDRTPENLRKLVAISHEFLAGHEGATSFSVGVRADDVDEPVSAKDFDVAVHVVFAGKAAKATYLASPRHQQFVDAGKDLWSQVRVFDSYLTAADGK